MNVEKHSDGTWNVLDDDRNVVANFRTNELAWEYLDRKEVHPLYMTRAMAEKSPDSWGLPAKSK